MRSALLRGQLCVLPSPDPHRGWVSPLRQRGWVSVGGPGREAVLYSRDSIGTGSYGAGMVLNPARGRCSCGLYPAPHITHAGELWIHPLTTGCKSVHGAG